MTLEGLKKWRTVVPFTVVTLCLLPWVLMTFDDREDLKLANNLIVPAVALVATFLYLGLDLRGRFWRKEIETHVGQQIRNAILDMIPTDLDVSEREKNQLAEREIFRKLTGVFWEAVDQDPQLLSHKQHFYANGIIYSTSFDVYLLGSSAAIVYAVAFFKAKEPSFLVTTIGLLLLALVSRSLVTPRARRKHLELSLEQLELLRRNQQKFVSDRFREIVAEWRTAKGHS